ncbi:Glycine dehydrogenase [compost metagenome]
MLARGKGVAGDWESPERWLEVSPRQRAGLTKTRRPPEKRIRGGAFPLLYSVRNGRVAHQCIVDLRPLKAQTGISVEDMAKRLMDFGFHALTCPSRRLAL